jgi:hypothetical protein
VSIVGDDDEICIGKRRARGVVQGYFIDLFMGYSFVVDVGGIK